MSENSKLKKDKTITTRESGSIKDANENSRTSSNERIARAFPSTVPDEDIKSMERFVMKVEESILSGDGELSLYEVLENAQILKKHFGQHWYAASFGLSRLFSSPERDERIMASLIERHKIEKSPSIGRRLIGIYEYEMEKNPLTVSESLKRWMSECLQRIKNGENAHEVFGLVEKLGRPKGSAVSPLRIACFIALCKRAGINRAASIEECTKIFGVSSRPVERAVKAFPLPLSIPSDLLKDVVNHGYFSELY